MAIVKLDGQDIPLDDAIAASDEDLRNVLVPFYPQLANAEITRVTNPDGMMIVRLIKKAGPKGNSNEVIEQLKSAPEWLNPAVETAWKVRQGLLLDPQDLHQIIQLQPQIQAATSAGMQEKNQIEKTTKFLILSPSDRHHQGVNGF